MSLVSAIRRPDGERARGRACHKKAERKRIDSIVVCVVPRDGTENPGFTTHTLATKINSHRHSIQIQIASVVIIVFNIF